MSNDCPDRGFAQRANMTRHGSPKPDLLFDVDGVLVHPAFQFRGYLELHHGITAEMTAPFFHGRFLECVTGRANLSDELEPVLPQWGWHSTPSHFIETWMREDGRPNGKFLELIAGLNQRGWKCHVASVQERNRAKYLRETVGFANAFDRTFFSCDVGVAKPNPEFFSKVQQELGKPPGALLLVDDSPTCIKAAHDAGWRTFHYRGPADQADLLIEIGA